MQGSGARCAFSIMRNSAYKFSMAPTNSYHRDPTLELNLVIANGI